MSDKESVSEKSANFLTPEERSGCQSREQSPTPLENANFDHSMESLLASDSCEEAVLAEEIPGSEDVAVSIGQRGKESEGFAENKFLKNATNQLEERRNDRMGRKTGSGKKRVSAHRERKISVSKKAAAAKVSFWGKGVCIALPTRSLQKCVKLHISGLAAYFGGVFLHGVVVIV